MEKFNVFDCSIIELDRHHSNRKGNLTVVENGKTLPLMLREYIIYTMCQEGKNVARMLIVI